MSNVLVPIATELFKAAEGMTELATGESKLGFVIDQIVKLDDATPLVIIPNKLEAFALKSAIQKIYDCWKATRKA